MEKLVIHKAVITAEAQFDYEEVLSAVMPKRDIKFQLEEYLNIQAAARRLPEHGRLRIKYLDETTDEEYLLFVYRGKRLRSMQLWQVKGVCRYKDYDEDLEAEGQIRAWLESEINPPPGRDWVWDYRLQLSIRDELRRLEEGGQNEIMAEVKKLLKNYKLNKMRIAVGDKTDVSVTDLADRMEFLDSCIEQLDDEARDIINCKYKEGISLRSMARRLNFSDTTIRRKVERALGMVETCFAERYEN